MTTDRRYRCTCEESYFDQEWTHGTIGQSPSVCPDMGLRRRALLGLSCRVMLELERKHDRVVHSLVVTKSHHICSITTNCI